MKAQGWSFMILRRWDRAGLDALREPLRMLRGSIQLQPMYVLEDELAHVTLDVHERRGLLQLDRAGLQLHAQSLAAKRRSTPASASPRLRDRVRAVYLRLRHGLR